MATPLHCGGRAGSGSGVSMKQKTLTEQILCPVEMQVTKPRTNCCCMLLCQASPAGQVGVLLTESHLEALSFLPDSRGSLLWVLLKYEMWLLQCSFTYLQQIKDGGDSYPKPCLFKGWHSRCLYTLLFQLHVDFSFSVLSFYLVEFLSVYLI